MFGQPPAGGLVELHWGIFAGDWLRITAVADEAAIRGRAVRVDIRGQQALVLSPEDAVIQVAVHLAVNHQMARPWLRGLLDIALLARAHQVDWNRVVERCRAWRLSTATWLVLDLVVDLLGLEELRATAAALAPPPLQRWFLARFVNKRTLSRMRDLRHGPARFLYQLLLVDRSQDAFRVFGRALWPEDRWLAARYGVATVPVRWRHLWNAMRGKL